MTVPTATCVLPMSGCTYPSWGVALGPGEAVGLGCQIVEQANAVCVAAANTPAPTTTTTAAIVTPMSSVR
jgi:hypothetical protein